MDFIVLEGQSERHGFRQVLVAKDEFVGKAEDYFVPGRYEEMTIKGVVQILDDDDLIKHSIFESDI